MGRRRDPVREADEKLQREGNRQAKLIHGAAAIALYRHWGWRKGRIIKLFELIEEVWNECAGDIDHSMVEMCEKETKIEIQCGDGKSWRDLHYLNSKVDPGKMTPAKYIYMRKQQMKWMAPQITAGVLLALHRKCGFGYERCARVYEQIAAIEEECGWDPARTLETCLTETGVRVLEKIKRAEGDNGKDKQADDTGGNGSGV